MANIIAAAKNTGAEAIHPGYGFLAENADFARACADNDLVFIGPAAGVHRAHGRQVVRPRDHEDVRRAHRARLRRLHGYRGRGSRPSPRSVGYPVLIKATAGGGGKGMREVHDPADLEAQYKAARTEAGAAFGNDGVYLEKLVLRPRHVEVQVLADDYRQRRGAVRARLLRAAPSSEAHGGGALAGADRRTCAAPWAWRPSRPCAPWTIATPAPSSFCWTSAGQFYFMEMNTRVQVEHPVTEQITGTDIIKEQLRIASGEPMSCADRAPFTPFGPCYRVPHQRRGPRARLPPVPRHRHALRAPGGPRRARGDLRALRFSHLARTTTRMVAKLVVYGQDREECLARAPPRP